MEATYDGECDYCDEPFDEGDWILHRPGWGWVHELCADEIDDDDEAGERDA